MFLFLKIVIFFFAIIFILAALVGIIKFFIDVSRWHQPESKVEIIPSIERGESDGRTDNSSPGADDTNSRNVGDDTNGTSDNDRNNGFQW